MPFYEPETGVSIHYTDEGEGRPIVFIHGWCMSGRVWRFQAEGLSPRFRVVAPDLRGHGRSTDGRLSLDSCVSDLERLFDRLSLSGALLVGWSMGSQIALAAVPKLRQQLSGLLLVGGTPRFTASDGYPHGVPATETRGMGIRVKRDFMKTMGEFFKSMFAEGEPDHDTYQRIVKEIVIPAKLPEPRTALEGLDILASADVREGLSQIDLPVLLVHGTDDAICPPGASQFMAGRIPAARLRLLQGVGHAPFLSRPMEFNQLVEEFAASCG